MPMIEVSEEEAELRDRVAARERIVRALMADDMATAKREMAAYAPRADTLAVAVRAMGEAGVRELGFDLSNLGAATATEPRGD